MSLFNNLKEQLIQAGVETGDLEKTGKDLQGCKQPPIAEFKHSNQAHSNHASHCRRAKKLEETNVVKEAPKAPTP